MTQKRTPRIAPRIATVAIGAWMILGAPALLRGQQDSSMSNVRADARMRVTVDSIRLAVLDVATFAGFADSSCAPGDLRTFERDTTGDVTKLLSQLELIVLSYGASVSLDSDGGRALLRALVRLEGGGPGPRWDMASGEGPRAFNPLLPLHLLNMETKKCEFDPGSEPDGIILPETPGFTAPRDSGALNFTVGYGPRAYNDVRNLFFARHRNEAGAVMKVTRVSTHAMWGDYAIVAVIREKESRGVVALPNETTGAAYAFHRVGSEWRLLAVTRSW